MKGGNMNQYTVKKVQDINPPWIVYRNGEGIYKHETKVEAEQMARFLSRIDRLNKNETAKRLGELGGLATKKKYGKKHFSNAGKLGMKKRWSK